jgi:hypothetical protein
VSNRRIEDIEPLVPNRTSGFLFGRAVYRSARARPIRLMIGLIMHSRSLVVAAGLLVCIGLGARAVHAQSVGIGPRISFADAAGETSDGSDRFIGGALRMGSGKTVIELAIDYRSTLVGPLLGRVKDMPIQASMLFFPVKSSIAPYLLGGVGWYSRNVEFSTVADTTPVDEATTRRFGYHAGLGGNLRITRHIGLFGDYRYTFLQFGGDDDTGSTPRLVPFAEQLRLSHEGSMFTWGAMLYF